MTPPQLYEGVRARNREDLYLWYSPYYTYFLRIVLPCGNVREWLNREDVPTSSLQCHCKEVDYEHWFIRYVGEDNEPQ